jgi:hypothetical protein
MRPAEDERGGGDVRVPGLQILSTGGIDAVPYAIAATACAPPTRYRRETPATWQAASVQASICPVPFTPGEQTYLRHPGHLPGSRS